MYKDYRIIAAGENEVYRWGRKARAKVEACKVAHNGFFSILADGDMYWTIGTSKGKYGEFAKFGDTFFSVNSYGFAYAKEGTEKGVKFLEMLDSMLEKMNEMTAAQSAAARCDDEDDEE